MIGVIPHDRLFHQDRNDRAVFRRDALRGLLLPPPLRERGRLRPGRKERWRVVHGLRLRHLLLLRGHHGGLFRTIRLEIRHRLHLDRSGERSDRLVHGVDPSGPTHPCHDPPSSQPDHARLFHEALRGQGPEAWRRNDHFRIPDPLRRFPLQRPEPPVRHGVFRGLYRVHRYHGAAHGDLRHRRRLHGHGDQRLYSGRDHVLRHHRHHFRGAAGLRGLSAGHAESGPGQ